MCNYKGWFIFAGLFMIVLWFSGYNTPEPPKTEDRSISEYLRTLYGKIGNLEVVTVSPNGVTRGKYGDCIIYTDSIKFYLECETTSPVGTAWKGVQLTVSP